VKLTYVLRRPRFPVLCEVPGDLIAAQTRQQLERRLTAANAHHVERLRMIDATGEGWGVDLRLKAISPFMETKQWTKAGLLELYKGSQTGQHHGLPVGEQTATKKRLPELILMIVEWISTAAVDGKYTEEEPASSCREGVRPPRAVTPKQGQYLSFIYYYTKIHGVAPAEADMQRYFRVSAAAVHQMVKTLESNGLIERTPGKARSIRLLLPREELPDLD